MVAASLLPVTIVNGELLFLFGKENEKEDSAKGYSDFGGKKESNESFYACALREGSEELTGFLGDCAAIKKYIRSHGGTFVIDYAPSTNAHYKVFLFYLPYSSDFVSAFNANHAFLWKRMDKDVLCKTKCFEKIRIDWFSVQDIQRRQKEFRFFYVAILDQILAKKEYIYRFINANAKQSLSSATRKKEKNKKKGG